MIAPVSFTTDAFQSLTREGRRFYVKVVAGGFVGVLRSRDGKGTDHTTSTLPSYADAIEELFGAHLVMGLVDKAMAESIHAQSLKQLLNVRKATP